MTDYIGLYLSKGKRLVPCFGRQPRDKGFQTREYTERHIRSHRGPLAWQLGERDLVIDIDARRGGMEDYERHAEMLGAPTVITPGGVHIYMRLPEGVSVRTTARELGEGIEAKHCPMTIHIAGNKGYKLDPFGGFTQRDAPDELVAMIEKRPAATREITINITRGMIDKAMSRLDHNMPNDPWVQVGMALHDWDEHAGLGIWEEWSKGGARYAEGECETRWKSFDKGGGVTIASLFHMADVPLTAQWWDEWVSLDSIGKLVHLPTRTPYRLTNFNALNNIHVPWRNEKRTSKEAAHKYLCDHGLLRVCSRSYYMPQERQQIFTGPDGSLIYNEFNPLSMPIPDSFETSAGLMAYGAVRQHLEILLGSGPAAEQMMDLIGHYVQFPGVKVRWSPLIQSRQGVGKGILGVLLKRLLGDANVGLITPIDIDNDFSAWGMGRCVTIMEELRLAGQNRHRAMDKIKPFITDDDVSIHAKGQDPVKMPNTTNYIAFTNEAVPLPLTEDDRRWWVIMSPVAKAGDYHNETGLSGDEYFTWLVGLIEEQAAQLALLFSKRKIKPIPGTAPMTESKREMIASERDNVDGLAEVEQLMSEGGFGYSSRVVSVSDLFDVMEARFRGVRIMHTRTKAAILRKAGLRRLHGAHRISGLEARRIYHRPGMTPRQAKEELASTFENKKETL